MIKRYRLGVIGYGGMGRQYVREAQASDRWEVAGVCEISPEAQDAAREAAPQARIVNKEDDLFADSSIDVVGLFTLADHRPGQIRRALAAGKHILAEKPIAAEPEEEWDLVRLIESSGLLTAVNLFNRNAWYQKEARAFVASGQIGRLGIVRVSHMTPGLMPGLGHAPEGPPFHDCGMHYVDVARWHAGSEYDTWHATGVRMWGEPAPWWVQAHGRFKNGVVFDITQGFVYGQMAKDRVVNCYLDLIGTFGIARFRHDFREVTLELHGVDETIRKVNPYGGKKLDIMLDLMARSLDAGRDLGLPSARDAAVASEVSWAMLRQAAADGPPVIGTQEDMRRIVERRRLV